MCTTPPNAVPLAYTVSKGATPTPNQEQSVDWGSQTASGVHAAPRGEGPQQLRVRAVLLPQVCALGPTGEASVSPSVTGSACGLSSAGCCADHRGKRTIQLSPPLTTGSSQGRGLRNAGEAGPLFSGRLTQGSIARTTGHSCGATVCRAAESRPESRQGGGPVGGRWPPGESQRSLPGQPS